MALVLADRVKVITTTTGTGAYTLGAAAAGFQDFAVVGDGNTTYYTVTSATDWEVGIGTYTASGTTLSRDTVLSSSNAGSAVNWSAGSKDVFVTYPSGRSVISLDGNKSEFSTGTRMVFAQTTAPTGWTKDITNYDNHALRVVTGTASTGGTVDFTTAFTSQTPTGTVTVTASTGQVAQGGSVSVSTGQVAQGGSVSVSTGQAAGPVTVNAATQGGTVSVSTGQAAGPVSVGNTTLAVPTIPSHQHTIAAAPGPLSIRSVQARITGPPQPDRNNLPDVVGNTGGGGAHAHPGSGGNHSHPASGTFTGEPHTHPASGGQHVHPASGTFTGQQHAHPASGTFSGQQHAHPVSAPASFSGSAINLAVKYVDVITATKDS